MTVKQEIRARMDLLLIDIELLKLKAKEAKFEIEDCPLWRENGHSYDECQILTGLGCYGWECPFCGFQVG